MDRTFASSVFTHLKQSSDTAYTMLKWRIGLYVTVSVIALICISVAEFLNTDEDDNDKSFYRNIGRNFMTFAMIILLPALLLIFFDTLKNFMKLADNQDVGAYLNRDVDRWMNSSLFTFWKSLKEGFHLYVDKVMTAKEETSSKKRFLSGILGKNILGKKK